jgi:hypothetical protein
VCGEWDRLSLIVAFGRGNLIVLYYQRIAVIEFTTTLGIGVILPTLSPYDQWEYSAVTGDDSYKTAKCL